MSILVTGGAGYIGSHAVHALLDAGRRVVVLDDLSAGSLSLIPSSVPAFIGDAADEELVASILRSHSIDAIMHFSGSTLVPESIQKPLRYYENNTAASRSLIDTAVRCGVRRFLFSSTAAVYGNPEHVPVGEDDATQPLSPYGRSKLMTEWMLRDASEAHRLDHAILRYFNVAGADPMLRTGLATPGATHVLKVAVEAACGKRPYFEIFGADYPTPDGTCIRDFIHVSDLADAHVAALEHLERGGQNVTLNCGYGRGYSIREVVETVQRVSGNHFPVRTSARREGDIVVSVANADRILKVLSWRPRYAALETIVKHALAWEGHVSNLTLESGRLVPDEAPLPLPVLERTTSGANGKQTAAASRQD